MAPTPLLKILTQNKLSMNNYKEWKRNLIIVLNYEKLKIIIDNKFPSVTQVEARTRCKESNKTACCYMLSSATSTVYK
ncbi:hypothetical protein J1N35_044373 [Gossypium stocksii]|uniref:Uncharacterized protein n=1 Tax=Gossypium stocksii TaxID=47602 RepID=A0A9D3U940_9ROSI|nr:hypothetical protein J1N35_044373 [Gossypium stocksii]